ncbi:Fe-S oxidoreductase [Psychrobacillus insolitus]|uniref:Fe-S oxidoreductase n=1 Tax=Psychrobacillus insolitus TaxID=1461 RepID=A0A2W7MB56_9BACI|nr:(Fe-S)-binding protein [Psychrobacillus insolitus]PZX02339.1 Fe-S oxidoreductase [Psychrobacillus insolitus]
MLLYVNLAATLAVTAYALYLFFQVVYSRYLFVKLGKKSTDAPNLSERINSLLVNGFGQKKLFKDKKSGVMHFILFYTFFILQMGLLEIIIKGFVTGFEYPLGAFHKYFSFMQEWTVFLMLCAVLYAGYRRYVEKLKRLQSQRDVKAAVVIIALSVLTTSILLTLGFESIMLERELNFVYAPFSSIVATIFAGLGTTFVTVLFYIFWWVHLLTVLGFMVFMPQSKQSHELFALFNLFFKKVGPVGRLRKVDFEDEEAEEFGVGKIEDFTQHQLIDLYACAECGRCTNMCPASGTGKTLSPMNLIVKLRNHLTEKGSLITSRTPWVPAFVFSDTKADQFALPMSGPGQAEIAATIEMPNLIGDVITEEEIWACTTCRNCEDQCPVMNEHVDKIIDLRRYLVMTQGEMPVEATRYFQNIERQGNPWGTNRNERVKWREGMEEIIKTVDEVEEFDVLFWVGSMGSFDIRNQKIARSFTRLLDKAGVKFAILGNQEGNSGDTARRMGNEYLFQELCMQNIETFQSYNVRKIVTTDPHAFNTFKNEYPEFGLKAEVFHHTQLLADLLQEGKLKPTKKVDEKIAYHDSCYIGRYNDIYESPRDILRAIPGIEILEMERNRENSLCCGAGGGRMWMEEREGTRMNIARTEMALETNPTVIGSNCPYCLTMISDGTKAKEVEEQVQTLDIAEIIEKSIEF